MATPGNRRLWGTWWLPNTLTALRLATGLYFPFAPEFLWLPLLIYAALSDLIDGWLSRQWDGVSTFGQLLDPVADKACILAVLYTVWQRGWVNLWELGWLASRDIMVLILTLIAAGSTRLRAQDLKPRWSGKFATGAQFVVLLIILYQKSSCTTGVIWGGCVSAIAAADYLWVARHAWRQRERWT
ncbi:hypothetical protein GC163_14150 [bacterium]|nr:hypothetical protein [bacterium]